MSATTAVKETREGRLGVMVRTAGEIFVYWEGAVSDGMVLRITDLTGRPPSELLDGRGWRELEAAPAAYVPNLQPGHMYYVEVGRRGPEGFFPLLGAGPVQTPWLPEAGNTPFPAPYHRS